MKEQKRKKYIYHMKDKTFYSTVTKWRTKCYFSDFLHNYWCRFFILAYYIHIYSAYTAMQTFLIFIRSISYIKEWNSVENQKRAYFEIDRLILESFEIVMS